MLWLHAPNCKPKGMRYGDRICPDWAPRTRRAQVEGNRSGRRREWEPKENVAAVGWKLDAGVREEIDAIFAEEGVPTHADTAQMI